MKFKIKDKMEIKKYNIIILDIKKINSLINITIIILSSIKLIKFLFSLFNNYLLTFYFFN